MNKEVSITITLKEYEELSITKKKYEKLKKQFEQYQEEICILDIRTDENIKYKNQQKEFIEYMNKTIEELECGMMEMVEN